MKTYYINPTVEIAGEKPRRRLKKRTKRNALLKSFDNLLCTTTRFLEGDFEAVDKAMNTFAIYVFAFTGIYLLAHLIIYLF